MTPALEALIASQKGVFTTAQAEAAGVSRARLRELVSRREVRLLGAGVFAVDLRFETRVLGACLALPAGVVSHATAARIQRLEGCDRVESVHLSQRGRRGARKGPFTVHRPRELGDEDIAAVPPFERVTTTLRTVIDLAEVFAPVELAIAFEHAHRSEPDFLERVGARLAVGRHPAILHRLVVDAERRGRPFRSPYEVRLWWLLRNWGLRLPETNVWIQDEYGHPFEWDFVYPRERLVIEVDGRKFRDRLQRLEQDDRKQSRGAAMGYRTMRFTPGDFDDTETMRALVTEALAAGRRGYRKVYGAFAAPAPEGWPDV